MKDNYPFLILLFPAILVVFLFNYLPIYGVLIAFQDFMPGDDIFSEYTIWVGFENFERFFSDIQFWTLMKNTFQPCIEGFLIGFPLPIIVALMINALAPGFLTIVPAACCWLCDIVVASVFMLHLWEEDRQRLEDS